MSQETRQAIEMLQYWDQFTDVYPKGNCEEFARWLLNRSAGIASASLNTTSSEHPVDGYAGQLLGRLTRFASLWSKKMFDNLPLRTMEEYGILRLVEFYPNARKSDIVYHSLLEPTTCFEILKRLQKMGFLADEPDETDRRSRRVHITPEGQALCRQVDQQLVRLSSLLLGRMDDTEKETFVQLLQQLDDFHKKIYERHRDATLGEIIAAYLPTRS